MENLFKYFLYRFPKTRQWYYSPQCTCQLAIFFWALLWLILLQVAMKTIKKKVHIFHSDNFNPYSGWEGPILYRVWFGRPLHNTWHILTGLVSSLWQQIMPSTREYKVTYYRCKPFYQGSVLQVIRLGNLENKCYVMRF